MLKQYNILEPLSSIPVKLDTYFESSIEFQCCTTVYSIGQLSQMCNIVNNGYTSRGGGAVGLERSPRQRKAGCSNLTATDLHVIR